MKQNEWKVAELVVLAWIAVLFAGLAYPVYGLLLRPEKAPEWTQAIASAIAIAAGAGYVRYQHRLERQARVDELRSSQAQAVALLVFQFRAISYEVANWRAVLDTIRESPYRHFELPGNKATTTEPMPLEKVAFLLQTNWALFEQLQHLWVSYGDWKYDIALRADVYVNQVQPPIKEQHVRTGIDPTPQQKAEIAGPVLTKMLRNGTDNVYVATDNLQHLLQFGLGQQVEQQLRSIYPELKEVAHWLNAKSHSAS